MLDSHAWRDRAYNWRAMATACEDAIIRGHLLSLADEADAVAAELCAAAAEALTGCLSGSGSTQSTPATTSY